MTMDLLGHGFSGTTRREIGLRLDAQGRFWHEGILIENPKLVEALHKWISSNPDDGRYVVSNGYDWVYLHVEDAPYMVKQIAIGEEGDIVLSLSDETKEPLDPHGLTIGEDGALYVKVKDGRFEAKFSRHAQTSLAPVIVETEAGEIALRVEGEVVPVG